jgi:hypothetical protein
MITRSMVHKRKLVCNKWKILAMVTWIFSWKENNNLMMQKFKTFSSKGEQKHLTIYSRRHNNHTQPRANKTNVTLYITFQVHGCLFVGLDEYSWQERLMQTMNMCNGYIKNEHDLNIYTIVGQVWGFGEINWYKYDFSKRKYD